MRWNSVGSQTNASDLENPESIEQDADVVMFIYRDDYYHKDTEKKDIAEIINCQQRNGPSEQ